MSSHLPGIKRPTRFLPAALLALQAAAWATPAAAQDPGPEAPGWNSPRAQELMRRARITRRQPVTDTAFQSYQADARGFVYFFLDRVDSDERTLVKADQIALEIFWKAPNQTHQRIVGLRDEKALPTNIRYHMDHLTVVQDDFGDWITLGDGDEVSRVLHPAGPGAHGIYDFRLADSLTLRYGGEGEEVRVYEVEVRPKAPDMPGLVGSVYLDRERAAIVRMDFTFTPASYVDPYLDYIRISLDNGLWLGRYWLPYRQEVELRRELPVLDFMAGSIIRGRFEIGGYEFNSVPDPILHLGGVASVPESQRREFPFERGLYDDLEEEGLEPAPSLEEVRARAQQMMGDRALSGLRPFRLHLRSFSDALRYNRAEGLFLGGGMNLSPWNEPAVRVAGGWSVAREEASGSLSLTGTEGPILPELTLFWDELRDLSPPSGTAPVVNTMGTAFLDQDWLDPYHARGARLTFRGPRPDAGPEVTLLWEDHRSAANEIGGDTRPVRPVEEDVLGAVELRLPATLPLDGRATATARLGRMGQHTFAALEARGRWRLDRPDWLWSLEMDASAGLTGEGTPVQERYHLGGRGTLGGHDYRSLSGRTFWLVRGVATRALLEPWLGLRGIVAVGGTHGGVGALPAGWPAREDGVRASVGGGLALGWDVLRLDLLRGLGPDGSWELTFSVAPNFHPWL